MPNVPLVLLCFVLVLGCSRTNPQAASKAPKAATVSAPPTSTADAAHDDEGVVVAIGDLHGDLSAARAALRLAGAIDAQDHWSGGKRTVVQTGDVLDRGDDEPQIVALFERLRGEAKQAGGAFIAMSGNHEVMNVAQDFRYVTPDGQHDFDAQGGRSAAFAQGGPYARIFAAWPVIAVHGDTLFVHGGVLPKHVQYGIERINREVAAWMRGELSQLPEVVADPDAPIWTRTYSLPGAEQCAPLVEVLSALKLRRMVVGHTVQEQGISHACDGRVVRIDVGMSRAYGGPIQVLELRAGKGRVLTGQR